MDNNFTANYTAQNLIPEINWCYNNCKLQPCEGVVQDVCRKVIADYIFPSLSEWFFIVINLVLFMSGLVGNALVCFVIWRSLQMHTVVNTFIFNLAFSDFLVILFCLPATLLQDVTETWYLGDTMCKIIHFIQTTSVSVSVLTLSAISVERYFAICQFWKVKPASKTISCILVIIWCVSCLISIPHIVYMTENHTFPESMTSLLTFCKIEMDEDHYLGYNMLKITMLYVLPVLIMTFTYSVISRHLWKNELPGVSEEDQRPGKFATKSGPESQMRSRRRAAKMLITIVAVFVICFFVVHLIHVLRSFELVNKISDENVHVMIMLSHALVYLSSAVNPIIYNFMSAKFRKEFRVALSCCRKGRRLVFRPPQYTTSSGRNRGSIPRGSIPRSERFTMNTYTNKHGWFVASGILKKAVIQQDKYD
ncbi:orexin receptor type 2-like [Mytilus californianus]|uniref:orexin receptor type 2-like n=1 Tax=Mytilus californianus TaxID=6549 RepID=UPI002245C227|nr:orexin receptor type 2-like [Mytilus californianus]